MPMCILPLGLKSDHGQVLYEQANKASEYILIHKKCNSEPILKINTLSFIHSFNGILVDGQAGPCMGQCMGWCMGAWWC